MEKTYADCYRKVVFKWGVKQYPPRETGKRDSGILYHFADSEKDAVWRMKHIFRTENFENHTGGWNTIEIICSGNQSEHYVNGHLVNCGTHASVSSGKILLRSEGAEV